MYIGNDFKFGNVQPIYIEWISINSLHTNFYFENFAFCEKFHKDRNPQMNQGFRNCDPGGIQTHDLQNRNLTFYSAELRDQCEHKFKKLFCSP